MRTPLALPAGHAQWLRTAKSLAYACLSSSSVIGRGTLSWGALQGRSMALLGYQVYFIKHHYGWILTGEGLSRATKVLAVRSVHGIAGSAIIFLT